MKTNGTRKTVIRSRLALEDGTIFEGRAFGAARTADNRPITVTGEVVFNTAMSGYQESLTDPSYAGQILVMTTPMIGNYGVNTNDVESASVQVTGYAVRELTQSIVHHRADNELDAWLADSGVPGIEGIDTRALTRRLRVHGVMRGALTTDDDLTDERLVQMARAAVPMAGRNLVQDVSTKDAAWFETLPAQTNTTHRAKNCRVVALDCGAKRNILRHLTGRGCEVLVVPFDATADQIKSLNPDGLFVSNGPGDPSTVANTITTLRELAGTIPTFGICLGHQLLCLALGAETYKLSFGHRGANQPVKNLLTGRVEITSQNHGFAVDPDSIADIDCEPTHIHLNDKTLAGFRHKSKPILAVQYHPEASPGPHDAAYLFDCFLRMIETGHPITADQMEQIWTANAATLAH